MRNVALLGRLREVATTVRNNDLSAGELSKGSGICEHAVYLTALQRERVAAFKVLSLYSVLLALLAQKYRY